MDLKTRISTALATGSLVFGLMAPAALAADLEISDNGPFSSNNINVNVTTVTTVNQTNNTTVTSNINSTANTGGNSASFNNGGNTTINTGPATSNVSVNVTGNTNNATVPDCGCNTTLSAEITGNGPFSVNKIKVTKTSIKTVSQKNKTTVTSYINSKAKTGNNTSSFNNGGSTDITTDSATSNVSVNVTGGTNTLTP